jgi:hypothetical protein
MRRLLLPILTLSAAILTACDSAAAPVIPSSDAVLSASPNARAAHLYEVVVTNLTTGQPLSPAVAVTHTRGVSLFGRGQAASDGIRAIAEDGNPAVAAAGLAGIPGVSDVVTTAAPIGIVGSALFPSSLRFEITAAADANFLSFATMLICSNDGFAGLDAVRLPHGAATETAYAAAYDAGTEANDEASGSIVPPCFGIGPVVMANAGGGGRVAEQDVIRMHPGIVGGAALSSPHAWSGAIARVTIRRLK